MANTTKENQTSFTATLWVIAAVQFLTPFMFSAIDVAIPVRRYADIYRRKKMFFPCTIVITLAHARTTPKSQPSTKPNHEH